ncbi:MAG: MFS transporter [Planctomycetota bacterium]
MKEEARPVAEPDPPKDDGHRDRFLPIASWAMYDFANTIYSGIVVTFFLAIYLTDEIGLAATFFGVATTLSLITSGLISPFLGSIPDLTGKTKRYCLITTVICVACTALLSGASVPLLILGAYFLANVMYQVAMVFYNALLPTVASPRRQGFVSGWGVALGYIGVILALLVAKEFITCEERGDPRCELAAWSISGTNSENSDDGQLYAAYVKEETEAGTVYAVHFYKGPERTEAQKVASAATQPGATLPRKVPLRSLIEAHPITGSLQMKTFTGPNRSIEIRETVRWVFLVAAVLFLLFTLPLLFFVPERRVKRPVPFSAAVARQSFGAVWETVKSLPANRNLLFFLVGNILCVDVLNTAIAWFSKYFKAVYAYTFNDIIVLGLGISGSAFLAGLAMGKITDKLGSKPTLLAAAVSLTVTLGIVGFTPLSWLALGAIFSVGALGLAGLWVAGRKLLIELAPADRIGEYFGLYGITIKISVIGTTLFAVLVDVLPEEGHWNYRLAILTQLILIVPGIFLLWRVKTTKPQAKPSTEG